jgi:hypothetical protein
MRTLPDLAQTIIDQLLLMSERSVLAPEIQLYRDGLVAFRAHHKAWFQGISSALHKACIKSAEPLSSSASSLVSRVLPINSTHLELMDDVVIENKILVSRLALRLQDLTKWALNDLRLRVRELEGLPDLRSDDIFRPEVLSQHLVTQWLAAKLPRELWVRLQDFLQDCLSQELLKAYHLSNAFLIEQGVMADIDLRPLMRRAPSVIASDTAVQADDSGFRQVKEGSSRAYPLRSNLTKQGTLDDKSRARGSTTPLNRARVENLGVMEHLRRLMGIPFGVDAKNRAAKMSPGLKRAIDDTLSTSIRGGKSTQLIYADSYLDACGPDQLEQIANRLRESGSELKKIASNPTEKATIEIVALMFQSILAEERIPPVVRVWFARLQMPVLRVAIAEPAFFGSLQHPARRLIDRMGSCVLGFDVVVAGSAMEGEIRRVVQVIEQYPETGQRVFQLVCNEFELFLSKLLSEQGRTARVVSIVQQIEQKETMVILYTIELRNMLNDMPVRDEIREFFFKVWAEVLAIAAMRMGPQHEETLTFKRAAADLVWAASAKPNRIDRAKVIADLPQLLQLLRHGMSLLNLSARIQDSYVKAISDILAEAFMSKTDSISPELIAQMAKRLNNLEDYLREEDVGELPLDAESLVMMIGIDASDLEVVTDGGGQSNVATHDWALELQIGSWFSLDHNGRVSQVQFAWRSKRKQLHLFAAPDGRSYLIQLGRLSAYLQAGLLVPTEDETLTMRATREALNKLDANPERLLN